MIAAALDSRWLEITDDLRNRFSQRQVIFFSFRSWKWLVDGQSTYLLRLPFCTYVCI